MVAMSLILSACAAPKTKVRQLVPAAYGEVTQYRNIAILPFTGEQAEAFDDELEGELAVIIVQGKPFFNVVERVRLKYALRELELSQGGFINPQQAVKVGHFIGAQALYTGQVKTSRVDYEYYEETRSKCVQRKDPDKTFSKCLQYEEEKVDCTRKTATFHFIPKVIAVQSSRVVYSRGISKTAESEHCEDKTAAEATDVSLIAQAKKAALETFKRDIAPNYVEQELTIMDDISSLPEAAQTRFKAALVFAENDRMDRACVLWQETAQLAPSQVSVIYNLGLCAETQANYTQALALYRQADGLLSKPDDTVSAALSRMQQKIREQKTLREQIKPQA